MTKKYEEITEINVIDANVNLQYNYLSYKGNNFFFSRNRISMVDPEKLYWINLVVNCTLKTNNVFFLLNRKEEFIAEFSTLEEALDKLIEYNK
jgi:hypothetical protein